MYAAVQHTENGESSKTEGKQIRKTKSPSSSKRQAQAKTKPDRAHTLGVARHHSAKSSADGRRSFRQLVKGGATHGFER